MDYRDYIEVLRENDLLVEIDEEVSWNLEAAAITAMNHRVENGQKAHLYNKVKGYKDKGKLFGAAFAASKKRCWERANLIFGLPKDASWTVYRDTFIRRFKGSENKTITPTKNFIIYAVKNFF